jgi:peptidyl-prolyl cis-trans isomerase C
MTTTHCTAAVPSVNGRAIARTGEALDDAALRQRACTELLRQAAVAEGLLPIDDTAPDDGVIGQPASQAIEHLLELRLQVPEPDEAACRRHHAGHQAAYRRGERVRLRHVLFAVTPGVDVVGLRQRAEQTLLELRCDASGALFAERAATLSNCPTGADGGALGWLQPGDCAPEFAREVFGQPEVGVLPRLVHSRFGLHVVEVLERDPGQDLPYEEVRDAVRLSLRQRSWAVALRQYLLLLAGQATLVGISIEGSDTPLIGAA